MVVNCENCGKECKNERGLTIHQRMSKCGKEEADDVIENANDVNEVDEVDDANDVNDANVVNDVNVAPIKFIDLFCGIGSFHYAFNKVDKDFECVMASDIYEPAKRTYQHNYNIEPMGDICDIDPNTLPPYDVLCAGFPCQPFSQAGYRKGFDDDRGTMFSQVMRFVKTNTPKIIILENVQGLLNHDNGKTFSTIKDELTAENYTVIHKVLTCNDYGIPQMRKRLFIVCFKNIKIENIDEFFNLEEYKKSTTLTEYLGKNFDKGVAYTLRCGGKNSPINDRHNWDGYIVDDEEYRLSIDDGLKLQGFENIQLVGTKNENWKMLGNTIPTIFTTIIAKQIIKLCTI